jgi:quercetin dioxygenase-like cupin family protein
MDRREWIAVLIAAASAGSGNGADATHRVVLQHDLPDVKLDNWAVTALELTYPPGGTSASHRHPGFTVVCVIASATRSKVASGEEKVYSAGDMFFEMPNDLHSVSRNASDTKPARFLALLFAEKGKALTTPA